MFRVWGFRAWGSGLRVLKKASGVRLRLKTLNPRCVGFSRAFV